METAKRITPFDALEAARHYVDLLNNQDHVVMIALEESRWDGLRLWTVIDAPPFEDDYRRPIYDAEGSVIDMLDEPVFDFRLVNIQELSSPLDTVVPADKRILFEKPRRG